MNDETTEMPEASPNIWLDANFIEEFDFIDDTEALDIDDFEVGE